MMTRFPERHQWKNSEGDLVVYDLHFEPPSPFQLHRRVPSLKYGDEELGKLLDELIYDSAENLRTINAKLKSDNDVASITEVLSWIGYKYLGQKPVGQSPIQFDF